MNTVSIIQHLRLKDAGVNQVWLSDDAAAGGKIKSLHSWHQNIFSEEINSVIM